MGKDPMKDMYEVFTPSYHYDPLTTAIELTREKQRKALIKICSDATDAEDARMLMEALGYLPHKTYARINNRVTETTDKSQTNGYLESIGRL